MSQDTAEKRLTETVFLIEATDFERFSLWERFANDSDRRLMRDRPGIDWKQSEVPSGWLVTVGEVAGNPCCVSLCWERLNGHLVCFFNATSQVVDHRMIEEWLEKHFTAKTPDGRRAWTDAHNFHHVFDSISERKAI